MDILFQIEQLNLHRVLPELNNGRDGIKYRDFESSYILFFAIKTTSIVEKQEFTIYGGDIHGSYD